MEDMTKEMLQDSSLKREFFRSILLLAKISKFLDDFRGDVEATVRRYSHHQGEEVVVVVMVVVVEEEEEEEEE